MKHMINGDVFVHENIFPVKLVKSQGKITNSENLLSEKELQITTSENGVTSLRNGQRGKNAFVVLDFGKEIHGKIRLLTHKVSGVSPAEIRITYGESVSEALSKIGNKGASNDHSTRDFVFPVPPYSDMSFNESGFRFAKIELLSKDTVINIKAITATAIYRDIPYLGSFVSSNETLNRIYEVSAYTCHLNMQQYIWDGIKRDRLVWIGDMHPEMLTVKTVFGANDIIDKSLRFMRESTPLPSWMNGMPTYSLWWIVILYDWYFYTGNTDFLSENKAYASELIKIICSLVNDDGSDNLPSYFIDWPCCGKKAGVSGSRALLAMTLTSCGKLADLYGDKALSVLCNERKNRLISTKPKTYGAKQVAAMYSLCGWLNEEKAADEILKNGAEGFSTFMSYYLLKAASKKDMAAALSALEEYYGGMLSMGATTFWEDFDIKWLRNATGVDCLPEKGKKDIHADNGAFCYKGLRHSLCHGWSSAPAAFLAEEVLGIKILEAGCRKIAIKPNPGNLSFVKGTYPTPHGIITVEVTKTESGMNIEYTAPKETEIIL